MAETQWTAIEVLKAAGHIIPPECHNISIDIGVGYPVQVTYKCYADKDLLEDVARMSAKAQ